MHITGIEKTAGLGYNEKIQAKNNHCIAILPALHAKSLIEIERQPVVDLFNRLIKYSKSDIYPFCMPGHKRQVSIPGLENPYAVDITEVEGFDDLHAASGILKHITDNAEKIYRAAHAYMSVNGSTACNLAAVGCLPEGKTVLIAANCHRSVINGAKLSDRKYKLVEPDYIPFLDTYAAIDPLKIEDILKKNRDICGVVITSPSYEGFFSDVEKIAEIVHRHGAYLIVDEAHGAHLPFFEDSFECDFEDKPPCPGQLQPRDLKAEASHIIFPRSALYQNADIVVHSLHKTLGAFNQSALAFVNNEDLTPSFAQRLLMVTTTSPSYMIMAGIEHAFTWADSHRYEFKKYAQRLASLRDHLTVSENKAEYSAGTQAAPAKIKLIDKSIIGEYNISGLDWAKILLVPENMDGDELYMKLYRQYGLQLEKHNKKYALAMTSVFDTEQGFDRLQAAVEELCL